MDSLNKSALFDWEQAHSAYSCPCTKKVFYSSEPIWEPQEGASNSSEFWAQLTPLLHGSWPITLSCGRIEPSTLTAAGSFLHICCFSLLLCLSVEVLRLPAVTMCQQVWITLLVQWVPSQGEGTSSYLFLLCWSFSLHYTHGVQFMIQILPGLRGPTSLLLIFFMLQYFSVCWWLSERSLLFFLPLCHLGIPS